MVNGSQIFGISIQYGIGNDNVNRCDLLSQIFDADATYIIKQKVFKFVLRHGLSFFNYAFNPSDQYLNTLFVGNRY